MIERGGARCLLSLVFRITPCYGYDRMVKNPLKSVKHGLYPIKQQPPRTATHGVSQPIVIDFPKRRAQRLSPTVFHVISGICVLLVIASMVALFILENQTRHLWREAQRIMANHVESTSEPVPAFSAILSPLPDKAFHNKAFILGTDFQNPTSSRQLELAPMLEHLPIHAQPAKSRTSFVDVETEPAINKSAHLQQQADKAVEDGQTGKAIDFYSRAIRLTPEDATLRNNCVALILRQARAFDEQNDTPHALALYKKAKSLWQGDTQTSRSIHERIVFLERR